MPVSQFADPTVAIEPPPQQSEFDWAAWQRSMFNPFALVPTGTVTLSAAEARAQAPAEKSWTDVFTDIGKGFLGRIVGGYDLSDPAQLALYERDQEAKRKADQLKTYLLVGGIGAAVLVGALVLRGRR